MPAQEREDFSVSNPPLRITNPAEAAISGTTRRFLRYPAHLHAKDGSYVTVRDETEEAERLREGYHLTPWNQTDIAEDNARLAATAEPKKAAK